VKSKFWKIFTGKKMEFPPAGWEIFPSVDFDTAAPRVAGDTVMEVMAQVRPNGRCVDNWRIALGGSKILDTDFRLKDICKSSAVNPYKLKFQAWPRDIKLRRNMASTPWYDGIAHLERREFTVYKEGEQEEIKTEDLLEVLAGIEDLGKKAFSFRLAVGVGPDKSVNLELQGLPASEAVLMSKPAFMG